MSSRIGMRREVVGANAGQRAAVAADRSAHVVADEGFRCHGFSARWSGGARGPQPTVPGLSIPPLSPPLTRV